MYRPYMNVCMVIFPATNTVRTPYMTLYLVISLLQIPYVHTVYERMYGDFPAKNTIYLHCELLYVW